MDNGKLHYNQQKRGKQCYHFSHYLAAFLILVKLSPPFNNDVRLTQSPLRSQGPPLDAKTLNQKPCSWIDYHEELVWPFSSENNLIFKRKRCRKNPRSVTRTKNVDQFSTHLWGGDTDSVGWTQSTA